MATFDPCRARAKRPLPMWVDSFLRKTMDFSIAEIGAYHMILYAMWSAPDCNFPDDPAKLATVCRVSKRSWKDHYSDVLLPKFQTDGKFLHSKRLHKEAFLVENFVTRQYCRRTPGSDAANILKTIKWRLTADTTADTTTGLPADDTAGTIRGAVHPIEQESIKKNIYISARESFDIMEFYNNRARDNDWAQWITLTDARQDKLANRVHEAGGIDNFNALVVGIKDSPYLMGQTENQFQMNIDFLLNEDNFLQLREGKFNAKSNSGIVAPISRKGRVDHSDALLEGALRAVEAHEERERSVGGDDRQAEDPGNGTVDDA